MKDADVIVLGAGIIGVSVALHLQLRGRQTLLIDEQEPGKAASFGNAGIIQSEAIVPQLFPRRASEILRYAYNRSGDAAYHLSALPKLAKPFAQYWYNSRPDRAWAIARSRAPLIRRSIADHLELATAAGAMELLRSTGWTQVYKNRLAFELSLDNIMAMGREFNIPFEPLEGAALRKHEPQLRPGLAGGVHWPQPLTVTDPHALIMAYVNLFLRLGGTLHRGDARSLVQVNGEWRVTALDRTLSAPHVVVAMGMSSLLVTARLGYSPPLFAKRGYHMHYGMSDAGLLNRPILDAETGYVLAPMREGIRLTTGAEFAKPDEPPSPVQLSRVAPAAHELVPGLGTAINPKPWMGSRPCLPDMLPIIGPAPGHKGVWLAFGHNHQGLTLGPTTGRLLTQMMIGSVPFTDPSPYRPERFC